MNYGRMMGQYERTRVESSSKEELVILCYEKAVQFLGQARQNLADREFEKKGIALNKALGIINELQSSLNFENGGQIAVNLDRIYGHVSKRLLTADYTMDLTIFDETIRILSDLKEAWDHIASNESGAGLNTPQGKNLVARHSALAAA